MKMINLGGSNLQVSSVGLGCMRMPELSTKQAAEMIQMAADHGINFFDHADIYGAGKAEEVFAAGFSETELSREDIILQSKCGIVPGLEYNFTAEHIEKSVDGILKRLNTEYIDSLLLHRPDTLMEPEAIARVFEKLQASGKVRNFGVSNFYPGQVDLLQQALDMKLLVNQLQFGVMHTGMIDLGTNVNMVNDAGINRDGGILEYSRLKKMTIQAWSPFQYGFFEGTFLDNPKFAELNEVLNRLAREKDSTNTGIATAFILRHPAKMQVIAGTMNPKRITEITDATEIELTHQEWYEIYRAAGNKLP
ncbi:oxidoreductase [Dellaglioa algida]|nr:oxidoreductase [Dellaglioa algida]